MKLAPKILFLDLDGTLLDKGVGIWAKLSEKNANAVLEYSKKNIVVISTGRMLSEKEQEILKRTGAKYIICQNGSLIYDQSFNKIQDFKIENNLVQEIFEISRKKKIAFVDNDKKIIYGDSFFSRTLAFLAGFKIRKTSDFKTSEFNKILLISPLKKRSRALIKELEKKYQNDLNCKIVAKDYGIEITSINSSKGKASLKVAEIEKINIKETMHIGDSMNDSSTKNIVGTLVAMESGSKRLKNIADEIGPRRRRAGIAKFIAKFN